MNNARAFAAGPKKNPFDGVKTSMGNSAFYKLPALGDNRLGKSIHIKSISNLLFYNRNPSLLY